MPEKKAKPEELEVTLLKPHPVADDDYYTAYANGVMVAHTFFDFQLHFSEVKVRGMGEGDIIAETFATIMMSPQHAKAFLRHLKENVEAYEAKFGELKLPDQLVQQTVNFTTKKGA